MKPIFTYALWLLALSGPLASFSQIEPFSQKVLNTLPGSGNYRLAHPFDIVYGPDNFLYITEKLGRIVRVDTGTGMRQILLDIRSRVSLTISRDGTNGPATSIGQNGMLGLALHPDFGKGTGKDSIYVAYTPTPMGSGFRISRFRYNGGANPSLTNETILIEGIPSSNDHSSGRLVIGPDYKLYYTCGDRGHNQFGNKCMEILSQTLPTAAHITARNYTNYSGKVLRINMDGSIPADNPTWDGVRSHIYTIGHRNPQGLVWEKNPALGTSYPVMTPNGKLFSSEHGPNTDDELNILESGRNYGWPFIAGDSDNVNYQYVRWFQANNCNSIGFVENPYNVPSGATVTQERQAPQAVKNNFRKPLKRAYTECTGLPASQCAIASGWLRYPTIAPSSVEYYNLNSGMGIPGWYPSLLVTTLRRGRVYRFKLNATKDGIIGDSIPYFASVNRYRDIALSPDGKIFLITDSIGSTSGPSGSDQSNLVNRGAILMYKYTGTTLALDPNNPNGSDPNPYQIEVFPNPATVFINVTIGRIIHKPIRYRLYDVAGRIAMENTVTSSNFNIYVKNLKRGMYVLKLYNGYNVEVRNEKVVLQ